jgi:acetate kinase
VYSTRGGGRPTTWPWAIDPTINDVGPQTDGDITAAGSTVRVAVVHAREDIEIARGAC